jgi:3-dehydroquinate synthase/3-phosphoshikimate 1-carboxyvinyltransferase
VGLGERAYPIYIGAGLLDGSPPKELTASQGESAPANSVVVTDENVWSDHGERFSAYLRRGGIKFSVVVLPPGEGTKSVETAGRLWREFAVRGLSRGDLVVAFGGGVIGDLTGFAASAYMRGVAFVQVPTTLLAQVDSSVGGKTAVNLPEGKNLVGTFHQPRAVIADTSTLATLPPRELRAGMSEVIKYAALGCPELLEILNLPGRIRAGSEVCVNQANFLGANPGQIHLGLNLPGQMNLTDAIYLCCRAKAEIVETDERDTGIRATLNFGHTFAHAIEKLGAYETYNHGEAVAAGMVMAARFGESAGDTAPGTAEALIRLMEIYGIDWRCQYDPALLTPLMAGDKKSDGGGVTLILLRGIGEPFRRRLPLGEIAARIPPAVEIPPSKSAAHRAVLCAALAGGGNVAPIPDSDDIRATNAAVAALASGADTVDCAESGTTLRLTLPLAALSPRTLTFTGRGRLMSRPIAALADALGRNGAEITQTGGGIRVKGPIRPGVYELPGDVSSQFVSGLLLALPLLAGDSEIRLTSPLQSAAYVDMTLEMMERFGVTAERADGGFAVRGGQRYVPADVTLEGDWSQAAFFLVAGALGRPSYIAGLPPESRQGDRAIADILAQCGIRVERSDRGLIAWPGRIAPRTVDVSDIPDLVPPLAALFAFADGESRIVGAGRLRHKESDRLAAVSEALSALGGAVTEDGDGLTIIGRNSLRGGAASAQNDHRIAMMLAVAGLRCEAPPVIIDRECVSKSYPAFWRDFAKIAGDQNR